MKQVTMESVKQRIADLESAGKVVGGLSLSSEFELACLRELVAVTEQVRLLTEKRDAVVAENVALKSNLMFWDAEDPEAPYEHPDEIASECEMCYGTEFTVQVAARMPNRVYRVVSSSEYSTETELVEGGEINTPATDAAIAALRAEARKEGAIFAANRMLAAWDAGFVEDTPESASDIARAILSMTEFMDDAPAGDFDRSFADEMLEAIARQLRERKGANHE